DVADTPVGAGVRSLADLWSVLVVSAVLAPLIAGHGLGGSAAATVGWLALAASARFGGVWLAPLLVGAVAIGAIGGAVVTATAAPPWTLLEPWWSRWEHWLPAAVLAGFVLPAAGLGQWLGSPVAAPGRRHLPWGVTGVALLVWVAASVRHGAAYELHL